MKRYTLSNRYMYKDPLHRRLQELEDKLESGQLIELPCKIGDTVYGVGYFDCQEKHTTDEKERYKIYKECIRRSGDCGKGCKYARPAIEEFVCSNIQISAEPMLIVGNKMETFKADEIITTKEEAEMRLKVILKAKGLKE